MTKVMSDERLAVIRAMLTLTDVGDAQWNVITELLHEVERLRAETTEWDSKEQALQKSIAEHQRVIAALEAHADESAAYNHRLVRQMIGALEITRAVAEAPIEIAKFGKAEIRVLVMRPDVRHLQAVAQALLASTGEHIEREA